MEVLGIDIGGSGIKGAPVNLDTGELVLPKHRIPTPNPSTPEAVAKIIAEIAKQFDWKSPIGVGFPAVVVQGVTYTAANVHPTWINTNTENLFSKATGCPTHVINDADAAGMAEMKFGAGKDKSGVVLIVTIGTGLGTALFNNGSLVPNTEFGHIELDGEDAEYRASDAARQREELTWKRWAKRFDHYLQALEKLLWPDLIILGGGASKKHKKFLHRLNLRAEVLPAQMRNEAGIVGAALSWTLSPDFNKKS